MNQPRNFTATNAAVRAFLLLALWALTALALAAPVAGTVTHLSGPLLAKKANGSVKILSVKSEVENGDTLVTEKNTYARVKFIDNSEITLKPATTLTIENFNFDEGKPGDDKANFNLVKGGLRSVSGLLGKRNREKFELKTPSATIGIRGTTFVVQYVEPDQEQRALASAQAFLRASTAALAVASDAPPVAPVMLAQATVPPPKPGSGLAPGLYLQVLDGIVKLSNPGGAQQFNAGQFGYVPGANLPPVILPANPGLVFTPPPVFNQGSTGGSGPAGPSNSDAVDCIVR